MTVAAGVVTGGEGGSGRCGNLAGAGRKGGRALERTPADPRSCHSSADESGQVVMAVAAAAVRWQRVPEPWKPSNA
jgi:hypothetical protein